MKPTKAVLRAFAHVKSFHPALNSVFFNREGQWCYMDDSFNGLKLVENIDISILEEAVDSLRELPFIYQKESRYEENEFLDYVALHNLLYNGQPLKSWITEDSYINLFENWDVLADVIEKIESLGFWVNRDKGNVSITDAYDRIVVENIEGDSGISATYKACVQFARNKKLWKY